MFTQLGEQPRTIFLKGIESHKLHQEFEVSDGATVKKGQPVILHTDGTVKPAPADADVYTIIGYSIHNGGAGDLVTVGMKAFTIVFASSNAAINAGPVQYKGLHATLAGGNFYNQFANSSTAAKVIGWALDKADDGGDIIRVALF